MWGGEDKFLVLGSWFLVPGSWFLVPGSWFLVGGWSEEVGARRLERGGWSEEAGARRLERGGWSEEVGARRLERGRSEEVGGGQWAVGGGRWAVGGGKMPETLYPCWMRGWQSDFTGAQVRIIRWSVRILPAWRDGSQPDLHHQEDEGYPARFAKG